jgi:flagellar hook assembly protein FlgD
MNALQQVTVRPKEKSRRGMIFIVWSVVIALLLTSLAFTVSAQQTPAPAQLTLTVSSQGITPGTATVNAGVIRLTIENQKTLERVTLHISDQSGQLVREISVPDKSTQWNTELNLAVGQYVISDVSNSSASCRITVQTPPQR